MLDVTPPYIRAKLLENNGPPTTITKRKKDAFDALLALKPQWGVTWTQCCGKQ